MNQLNIRTTFDNDGYADSHEIKYGQYKLLANYYSRQASQIKVWDQNKNCITRIILYTPIYELKHTTLKILIISAIDSRQ